MADLLRSGDPQPEPLGIAEILGVAGMFVDLDLHLLALFHQQVVADHIKGERIGREKERVHIIGELGRPVGTAIVLPAQCVGDVEHQLVANGRKGEHLGADVEEEGPVEARGIADGGIAEVFGGHGDAVAGVFEGRDVDDPGQFLGHQFAEIGVFAVEDMLVEVGSFLVALDIGPVKDLLIKVAGADVGAVGFEPAAVVLAFAAGGVIVHGLQSCDGDPGKAFRGVARIPEHVIEAVPDDDLLALEAGFHQPGDDRIGHLEVGGDDARSDRVDLDADNIFFIEKEFEAFFGINSGQLFEPFFKHRVDHFRLHLALLVDPGVGHLDDAAGKRTRQRVLRFGYFQRVIDVGFGPRGRLRFLRLLRPGGGCAEQQAYPRAQFQQVAAVDFRPALHRLVFCFPHSSPFIRCSVDCTKKSSLFQKEIISV